MDKVQDKDKVISHWITMSDEDFLTMEVLYSNHRNSWALFTGHLVIEKLAKALYVKQTGFYPPMIHDLRRIIEKSGIDVDEQMMIMFDSISRFNINARYDDYKRSFSNQCTDIFTEEWIFSIKKCRVWIKEKL